MKIDKLTDNKIRVIAKLSDFSNEIIDNFDYIINFVPQILERAKNEFNFNTSGCKLNVELISSFEDVFVFTITKHLIKKNNSKVYPSNFQTLFYNFKNFEDFCCFYEYINSSYDFNVRDFCDKFSLFYYDNSYFLFIKNLDASNIDFKTFDSIACEFSNNISDDINFKYNLFKYGKLIINKNIFTLCNSDK